MSLIQLWEKNPEIVLQKNIKQLVSLAGDGNLLDESDCSKEIRYYLRQSAPEKLREYIKFCLTDGFEKSGSVLQDLINEIGRRLGYEAESGLYQGRSNKIGYDGIWESPDGHVLIIESKTTDAYRINLDTVAGYRNRLIENHRITEKSSMLIVVGRQDTGDLEAQIRGSRHAWDARIISMEALIQLMELNVKSDEEETTAKIRSLLVPFEYTRLDNIIDIMFTTAKDVETPIDEVEEAENIESNKEDKLPSIRTGEYKQDHTPMNILEMVRKGALEGLGRREGTILVAHKRAQYWSSDKKVRTVCIVSKKYERGKGGYWYAYHPHQDKFLADGERSFYMLGCVGNPITFALPYKVIHELLPYLNMTQNEIRFFYHIHVEPSKTGGYELLVPKREGAETLDLTPYEIRLDQNAKTSAVA
jgi:hypothetical protein